MRPRRLLPALVGLSFLSLPLGACSSSGPPRAAGMGSPSPSPSASATPSPSPSAPADDAAQLQAALVQPGQLPGARPYPAASPPARAAGTTFCGFPAPVYPTATVTAGWLLAPGGSAVETLTSFPSIAAARARLAAAEQAIGNCPQESVRGVTYDYAPLGGPAYGEASLLVGWSSAADSGYLALVVLGPTEISVETAGATLEATESFVAAAVARAGTLGVT